MSQPALGRYLNDHLSGSEVAVRLLTRLSRRYARSGTGRFFADLLEDIRADQQALRDLTDRIGAKRSVVKQAAGRLAEVASRPKLRFGRYEPLGLFESLEMLALGILGKRSLWQALLRLAPSDRRLDARDLVRLEARAVDQHTRVEHRRLAMARTALGPRDRRPPSRHTGRRHDGARPLARVPEGIPAGAPR
jgi:hypothetical protein